MDSENSGPGTYDLAVLSQQPETDIGNGRRFAHRLRGRVRYCARRGWLQYEGGRWRTCTIDHIMPLAKVVAEGIAHEAPTSNSDHPRARWARKSAALAAMERMLVCARTEPGIFVHNPEVFDADAMSFNALNGTLVFKTEGGLRYKAHDHSDLITRIAPTLYDPQAPRDLWRHHLERVQPDPEVRLYLQRLFGSCLIADVREAAFFIFVGNGGGGKTTTLNVIRRVLGEYAACMDVRVLLDPKFESGGELPSPQVARIAGDTRVVMLSEAPASARLNEGLIKSLTGGAPIVVRRLHKEPFEFKPRFRLIMECNALPSITGRDDGIWRRLKVVHWPVQIARAKIDLDMEAKLCSESSGVLNWLIEGAQAFLRQGLNEPFAITDAVAAYRGAPTALRQWVRECVTIDKGAVVDQQELYADFAKWCRQVGHSPCRSTAFIRGLRHFGVRRCGKHSRSRREQLTGARLALRSASQAPK